MRQSIVKFTRVSLVLLPATLALTACMGSGAAQGDSAPKPSMLSGWFGSSTPPVQTPAPVVAAAEPTAEPDCPTVDIREGGTIYRQNGGGVIKAKKSIKAPDAEPANQADTPVPGVKVQFTIKNVARECVFNGGTILMKIGVEGTALIGSAGKPGPASAPLTFMVTRDGKTVLSRAAVVNTVIPADEEQAQFRLVQGDIKVPPGNGEIEVTVGFNKE